MNKNTTLITLLTSLACCVGTAAAAPRSLNINYQNYNSGHNYNRSNLESDVEDLRNANNYGDGNQRIRVFPSGSGYKRLRINFERGEFGRENYNARGNLADNNKYTTTYSFRFTDNWDFGRGGKLPGLGGGTTPAGGRPDTTGMTSRLMWRRDNRDNNGVTRNYLESYHYWLGQYRRYAPDGANGAKNNRYRFGDRTFLVSASKNQWYNIGMQVKLDTGNGVGRLKIQVNGVTRYNRTHRYLTNNANWQMNSYLQAFFYGGGDNTWAPSRDSALFYDNLRVRQSDL